MPSHTDAEPLRRAFLAHLQPDATAAITQLLEVAAQTGAARVFAVGGAVRDLILGRPIVDVDLAVEGDAIALARATFSAAVTAVHPRFGTTTLTIGGHRIDLAMTRTERYSRPGVLPRVAPASIDDDLRRRDFTINAMAIPLSDDGPLLDPCGGREDLEARRIRVLHDAWFRDDGTRILRAFRYSARLQFAIEPHTRELIAAGIPHIAVISGTRLRHEIESIIDEPAAAVALRQCEDAGVLGAVHPAIVWSARAARAFDGGAVRALGTGRQAGTPVPAALRHTYAFAILAWDATAETSAAIVDRLRLRIDQAAAVSAMPGLRAAASMLSRPTVKPSGATVILDRYPPASVAAFALLGDDPIAASVALRYLESWRHERPLLDGRALQDLGVPEGPQIRQGLQLLRAARLDGTAMGLAEERQLAERFARSIHDSATFVPDDDESND